MTRRFKATLMEDGHLTQICFRAATAAEAMARLRGLTTIYVEEII